MQIRYPGGLRKALTLSYDDGVEQDEKLLEILDKHGLKTTLNLNSGCFPPEGTVWPEGQIHRRLTKSAAKEVYGKAIEHGHEVAVHCLTHESLTELPDEAVVTQIMEDRKGLEKLFGGVIRGAAYPYGTWNPRVMEDLRRCGIDYCRTVQSTHDFWIPADFLSLHPTCHHADPKLMELADRFTGDNGWNCMLFYLWGHAYEFEAADNWDVIEKFAERIGGREDIWYCTNIEVVDYVNAYRKLRASADMRTWYNPTDREIWFTHDGKMYTVGSGETVTVE